MTSGIRLRPEPTGGCLRLCGGRFFRSDSAASGGRSGIFQGDSVTSGLHAAGHGAPGNTWPRATLLTGLAATGLDVWLRISATRIAVPFCFPVSIS
jgi:hypothetical protein